MFFPIAHNCNSPDTPSRRSRRTRHSIHRRSIRDAMHTHSTHVPSSQRGPSDSKQQEPAGNAFAGIRAGLCRESNTGTIPRDLTAEWVLRTDASRTGFRRRDRRGTVRQLWRVLFHLSTLKPEMEGRPDQSLNPHQPGAGFLISISTPPFPMPQSPPIQGSSRCESTRGPQTLSPTRRQYRERLLRNLQFENSFAQREPILRTAFLQVPTFRRC